MMTKAYPFIDGERIRKANAVGQIKPVHQDLASGLSAIPELPYIKLFPQRLSASNALSADGKSNPVVKVGAEGIVAVELLIDDDAKVAQFFALTSAVNGCGRKIVEVVVNATPENWFLAVALDWSGGFWPRMAQDYPRLTIF